MDVRTFENNDFDTISNYLHEKYFSGYWGNFNLNVVLCTKNDPLSLDNPDGSFEDCFSFFEKKFHRKASSYRELVFILCIINREDQIIWDRFILTMTAAGLTVSLLTFSAILTFFRSVILNFCLTGIPQLCQA